VSFRPLRQVNRQRRLRPNQDPKYLAWLRTLPCAVCERPPPSQAAHTGSRLDQGVGMGQKTPDRDAIPLCAGCHLLDPDSYHELENEAAWEKIHAVCIADIRKSLNSRHSELLGEPPCTETL
jgi:hypothetical protein